MQSEKKTFLLQDFMFAHYFVIFFIFHNFISM